MRRALSVLLASCFVPATLSAATLQLTLESLRDDGVHISVQPVQLAALPGCKPPAPFCQTFDCQAFVTPCPPGVPCNSGVYEMHIASPLYPQELILDYGTNYELSGSITRKLAPMVSGTCGNYSCVSEEPVAPASYRTPARDELGHWDVTTAEANEDTVWVSTRLVSNHLTYLSCVCQTCTEQCPFYSVLMTITPPILGARWYGGSGPGVWLDTTVKDGATNIDLFGLESPASMDQLKIALLPHVKYTFDGWFVNREMGPSCLQERCGFREDLDTSQYNSDTVGTRPVTWGHVKALYRTP